jgi:AraC-like DNA-binding protein
VIEIHARSDPLIGNRRNNIDLIYILSYAGRKPRPTSARGAARRIPYRAAFALIELGALDEAPIDTLAGRLGVGERQLRRLFRQHLGAAPVAVAIAPKCLAVECDWMSTAFTWRQRSDPNRQINALSGIDKEAPDEYPHGFADSAIERFGLQLNAEQGHS